MPTTPNPVLALHPANPIGPRIHPRQTRLTVLTVSGKRERAHGGNRYSTVPLHIQCVLLPTSWTRSS